MLPFLEIEKLNITIDSTSIIENLDLILEKGESLSIIGPNGAGKTMLIKALLGTIAHTGKIKWATNTSVGYVPQKIDADRHLPITFHNLLNAKAKLLHVKENDMAAMIKEVGLKPETLETPVGHLSGGEFQRALITFALIGRPSVLILDEPTASIDRPGEEQVYELIHRLQDMYNLTTILVSHDLTLVYRYSTKVLCLNKQSICFGTPQEVLTPEVLQRLYGSPFQYYHHIHDKHYQ